MADNLLTQIARELMTETRTDVAGRTRRRRMVSSRDE